jgi:hypothetical protein
LKLRNKRKLAGGAGHAEDFAYLLLSGAQNSIKKLSRGQFFNFDKNE